MSDTRELPKLRRRRGVAKALITHIDSRLGTLEGEANRLSTRDAARQKRAVQVKGARRQIREDSLDCH